MKPSTFEETVLLYERMIKSQMKKLGLYKGYDEYYQCGLIALWQAYERFDATKGDFSAYAMHTVRGYLLVELNKQRRTSDRYIACEQEILQGIPVFVQENILSYIEQLPTLQQRVLYERFEGGYSLREIAHILHVTYDQVRYAYKQGLMNVKKAIE